MSRPPIQLDLTREKLIVKPDGRLPKFYPPPKAVMVTPLYDTPPGSVIGAHESNRHRDSRRSDRERSRSHRRSREERRAVYTDSEYEDSKPFIPASTSSSYGRGGDYSRSRRHETQYEGDDDSYRRGNSQSRAEFRQDSRGALSRSRYEDSDSHEPPQRHRQEYSPEYREESPHRKLTKHRSDSRLHSGRSQSTLAGHRRSGSGGSDVPDIRNFLEDVQRYLKILPMAPDFRYSKCTGRKKAVCIGINYVGQKDELKGCANDARNMRKFLIGYYGFQSQDILLLVDDGQSNSSLRPTRKEMFNAMDWLVKGAQMHDSLFFHYSGHGGQSPDASGKEADGMDEVIFPVDYDNSQDIIDDELNDALVKPLPSGCRLTAIFDSCHSGTVLDLPYLHSAHGRLRGMSHISKRAQQRGVAPSPDVISFAACKDDETSADTFSGGVATGAMSHAFIQSLERNPNQTYEELLQHLRDILIPKYHQKAQLSGTHPVDLQRKFIV